MSVKQNKDLVRRYFQEVPNDVSVYNEILSKEFQVHPLHLNHPLRRGHRSIGL